MIILWYWYLLNFAEEIIAAWKACVFYETANARRYLLIFLGDQMLKWLDFLFLVIFLKFGIGKVSFLAIEKPFEAS